VVRFANDGTLIEITESIDPPPEIEQVAELLSQQRPEVRALFRNALVLAMIDDEKARVIGTRVEEEREWLAVETVGEMSSRLRNRPFRRKLRHIFLTCKDLWDMRARLARLAMFGEARQLRRKAVDLLEVP
jgi:hypothetical protein